jgi:hypothetical protein
MIQFLITTELGQGSLILDKEEFECQCSIWRYGNINIQCIGIMLGINGVFKYIIEEGIKEVWDILEQYGFVVERIDITDNGVDNE